MHDRKDLLDINAGIAKIIVDDCAKFSREAAVALIMNPLISLVLAITELWVKEGLKPNKVVRTATLDIVAGDDRARSAPEQSVCGLRQHVIRNTPVFTRHNAVATVLKEVNILLVHLAVVRSTSRTIRFV